MQACGKSYDSTVLFQDHILTHHNDGIKSFQCDLCEQSFFTKAQCRRHLLSQHLPINYKFRCKVCFKSFKATKKFRNHMRFHLPDEVDDGYRVNLDTNNFHCPKCSKKFFRKISLISHINKNHKDKTLKNRQKLC